MDDIVYKIEELKEGGLILVPKFKDELPDQATFYTNKGECEQKIVVGPKAYYITLHSSLFSGDNDYLDKLSAKQLRLFYNISKNTLKLA